MVDFPTTSAGTFTFNGQTYDAETWLTYFDNNVNSDPFIKTQFTNLLYNSGYFDTGGNLFAGTGRELWNQVGLWAASKSKANKPFTLDVKNMPDGIKYGATNDMALANFGGYLKSAGGSSGTSTHDTTGEKLTRKDVIVALKQFAFANGITIADTDLEARASQITGVDSKGKLVYGDKTTNTPKPTNTLESVKDYYRTKVIAPKYAQFADDIKGGSDVKDLAHDYISMISNALEIDPEKIDLAKDPLLAKALPPYAGKDYKFPNYTDFQKMVRQDDRWQYTSNAKDTLTATAQSIKQIFGF